jgi:hypothetical protein
MGSLHEDGCGSVVVKCLCTKNLVLIKWFMCINEGNNRNKKKAFAPIFHQALIISFLGAASLKHARCEQSCHNKCRQHQYPKYLGILLPFLAVAKRCD